MCGRSTRFPMAAQSDDFGGSLKGMGMKKTLLCATAALAMATATGAAHATDGWYVRGDVGYTFDGTFDYDPINPVPGVLAGKSEVEDGMTYGLGLGYGFDNGFRLEGAVTQHNNSLDVEANAGNLPVYQGNLSATEYVVLSPIGSYDGWDAMLNLYYDFDMGSSFAPYVGAGVGWSEIEAQITSMALVDTSGPTVTRANFLDDSESAFAYQLLAGFGYDLTEQLTFDLGYRYFVVSNADFGDSVLGVDYDSELIEHNVTAGLRWQFAAPPPPPPPPPRLFI